MFCPNCGKEINQNQEFCSHCGNPVGVVKPSEPFFGDSYSDKKLKKNVKRMMKSQIIGYRIAGVFLLIPFLVILYCIIRIVLAINGIN